MLKRQKLSYLIIGVLIGALVSFSFAYANSNIVRLIVDGEDITFNSDVPPQIINGRTLVPARALAERLGASVQWDGKNNIVVVISNMKDGDNVKMEPVKETTYKGLPAIETNGETYFDGYRYDTLIRKIDPDSRMILHEDDQGKTIIITLHGEQTAIPLTNENIQIYYGRSYINTKFYQE